jgi:hypothetical protein
VAGGDQVTACIDPLDCYIWRSTRGGYERLHRVCGPAAGVVSDLRKKSTPTRKSARAARYGPFTVSARVALMLAIQVRSDSR